MIEIDGAMGEGGGQVLRSALTLSLMTGLSVRIFNIRARRSKPGLRAQHLTSVQAAAAVGQAQVVGAQLGSRQIEFLPSAIKPGSYGFTIPTAGSTSLVLQTIFLPLSTTNSPSEIEIVGGTHVPWSPSFHYLEENWLAALGALGFRATLELDRAGFYPIGGGRLKAMIQPSKEIRPLQNLHRGKLQRIRGISAVANLPEHIARRQREQALSRLERFRCPLDIEILSLPSPGKGTILHLQAAFQTGQACYFGLGERGKPAERVADEAVDALQKFIQGEGVIDEYLADQLLLPLAFAGGVSEFKPSRITRHLLTNAEVIQAFNVAEIDIRGGLNQTGVVEVKPRVFKD